jgi:hypothetical protein
MNMPRVALLHIAQRFARMIARLQPSRVEVGRARGHFAQVRARLSRTFYVARIIPMGSHTKGTAVYGLSDVDILAVLRRREARWGAGYVSSRTFLGSVQADLDERYPATEIRRDGQAAVIRFGQGSHPVDVVPGMYDRAAGSGHPIYRIPDGLGGWMATAPEIHSAYFREADRRSGGKLKHVVQLIKHWAQARVTPISLSSFHLEMVLAADGACERVMPYSHAVTLAFRLLALRQGAALRDPCGIAGLIPAANTDAKRESLVRALDYAAEHARAAYLAETRGDWSEAVRQWKIVFGDVFPLRIA